MLFRSCPYITYFRDFIEARFGLPVVYGTHPIPQKYLTMHTRVGTWDDPKWKEIVGPTMADEKTRLAYD